MTVWQNTLSYIWLSDWRSLVLQHGKQLIIFDINHKYVVQTASQNAHKLFSYISEVWYHSRTTKSNNKSINVHVRWINVKTTHLSHVTVRLRRRTGSLTPEKNAFQRENVCKCKLNSWNRCVHVWFTCKFDLIHYIVFFVTCGWRLCVKGACGRSLTTSSECLNTLWRACL